MKILVTGGCGFKGSVLVPKLVSDGHEVTVVDTLWFGNHLGEEFGAELIQADIRDSESIPVNGMDVIIHLANVANDPGVDLDQTLSWEINALASQQLADRAARAGVNQFIFASSGSVYGVKDEPHVTEDLELVPISAYNKTKMVAERALMSYAGDMAVHLVRPATVCGLSPRMRFDVSVNMFVAQSFFNGCMTVYGGNQVRPNIHINDVVDVYRHLIAHPDIPSGPYNAGFENISILSIAEMVRQRMGGEIVVMESNDPRSYRQDSNKLVATGFTPSRCVADAIDEVATALSNGILVDRPEWYTVKWMSEVIVNQSN